jgi:hypothetical protein
MPCFNRFLLSILLFSCVQLTYGQEFFRFSADFTIKEKSTDQATGMLVTGKVYYDKNLGKLRYDVQFPEPENWLIQDTFMYRVAADTLVSVRKIVPLVEYSFFHMILSQQLVDFGLAKTGYTAGNVSQDGRQVLSTWNPPAQLAAYLGPVVLAQENKLLTGVALEDKDGKVMGKFYLQDYQIIDGLPVPGKIYQVFYKGETEFRRLLTFKNIVLNQTDDQNRYDFLLPAGK